MLDGCGGPLRVAGALALAPGVVSFLGLTAFEVRRWWRVRQGQAVHLQGVVRGTAPGFHTSHMPGRVHLTPRGVWWMAEGSDCPVPVRGFPVSVSSQELGRAVRLVEELLPRDVLEPDVPTIPRQVPEPLWRGAMDNPATVVVDLEAGGFAEVSVRAESMGPVVRAILTPQGRTLASPPEVLADRTLVRFTPVIAGCLVALVWVGVILLASAGYCPASGPPWWLGSLGGLPIAAWGVSILWNRSPLVGRNSATLVHPDPGDDEPVPPEPANTEGTHADGGAELTYRRIRDTLDRRCREERWDAVRPVDPRDERLARRALGPMAINYARATLDGGARTAARYLLARDATGEDHLVLFPAHGDVAPLGVIDMMRPCLGAIPREGTLVLVSPADPRVARVDDEWVVPVLDSVPLWPAWPLISTDAGELAALVSGIGDDDA